MKLTQCRQASLDSPSSGAFLNSSSLSLSCWPGVITIPLSLLSTSCQRKISLFTKHFLSKLNSLPQLLQFSQNFLVLSQNTSTWYTIHLKYLYLYLWNFLLFIICLNLFFYQYLPCHLDLQSLYPSVSLTFDLFALSSHSFPFLLLISHILHGNP